MATQKKKRIKRGQFVRLPGGVGAVAIARSGAVLFKPGTPKKRANPTAAGVKKKRPKAKQPGARVLRSMALWVKSQIEPPKKKNGRAKKSKSKKGVRR
jgi:hypothetical protein